MQKLTTFIVAGCFFFIVLMTSLPTARASNPPRKRNRPALAKPNTTEALAEMVRRAEQAAEAAQAEARRAREQTEVLQQQLAQATKELAALRQSLTPPAFANCELRIADLKSDLDQLRTAIGKSAKLEAEPIKSNPQNNPPLDQHGNPQSAIRNPQSDDRLTTLEEQVELNTAQIKEHAQTKVESDSRFRVRLSGLILMNTFLNTTDSSGRSAPTRAPAPADTLAPPRNNIGANLRQSIIGLAMEGPRVGGARLSAETEFDFYGTNGDTYRGNVLGNLRMRTASARLDWDRTSLTAGLRPVMISPLNPTSLASVWYPALSGAGNLWQWRPQIILEHRPRLNDSSELVLQGGLLAPFGETLETVVIEGGLNYQGRIAYRHNLDTERKLEFGLGGLAGNRSFLLNRKETTYVVSSDWRIPIGNRFELTGEAYFGKANNLGEQSGTRADNYYALSGPLDNPMTTIRGIQTFGGWTQLNFKARRDLDFNFAFGLEDPRNRDVLSDRRNLSNNFRNQVASGNFIYQFTQNVLFSIEYRRLLTDYAAGRRRNDHYNLAIGYLF